MRLRVTTYAHQPRRNRKPKVTMIQTRIHKVHQGEYESVLSLIAGHPQATALSLEFGHEGVSIRYEVVS